MKMFHWALTGIHIVKAKLYNPQRVTVGREKNPKTHWLKMDSAIIEKKIKINTL